MVSALRRPDHWPHTHQPTVFFSEHKQTTISYRCTFLSVAPNNGEPPLCCWTEVRVEFERIGTKSIWHSLGYISLRSRDARRSEVRAAKSARISTPLVRFAKFFHRKIHHDRRHPLDAREGVHRVRLGHGGAQRCRTEVQALTQSARIWTPMVRFANFLRPPTSRDPFRPKSRSPGKRLAFPNAWSDSRNSFASRLGTSRGIVRARERECATLGEGAAVRDRSPGARKQQR